MARPLRVLLGVSGGIAAYKAAEIVRRLRAGGHQVRCALTRRADAFVAPLTLEVLSGEAVYHEEYLSANGSGEERHITASQWADVLVVAPATANLIARLALGLADDFLSTTALAFPGPLVLAPAMHEAMWSKEVVARHVATLAARGAVLVGPVAGALASGETGMGRMADPADIVAAVEAAVGAGPLAGRTVLVSAGPTREPIDPVRYISNRSSGKMGFALAAAAARRGARTLLVSGPVAARTPRGVERLDVVTAEEMRQAVYRYAPQADLLIMAAAVSDYRPREVAPEKMKKQAGVPRLDLVVNPDILAGLADVAPHALRVGFAAEAGALDAEARRKLESKRVDLLIANDISRSDIGFDSDANEVTVYRRDTEPLLLARRSKDALAEYLLDLFCEALTERGHQPAERRR